MIQPDFDKYDDSLIPAIVQDDHTHKVLMLGYMDQAALNLTQLHRKVTFYSRSRKRLWTKGESSGNYLLLVDILLDCDNDCLLVKVIPTGPTCHTGSDTCFNETNLTQSFLVELEQTISDRKTNPSSSSYVSSLFQKGINKIAQKVGEEAVEMVIEAKDENQDRFLDEAADLLFHYLILLKAKGANLEQVVKTLQSRSKPDIKD